VRLPDGGRTRAACAAVMFAGGLLIMVAESGPGAGAPGAVPKPAVPAAVAVAPAFTSAFAPRRPIESAAAAVTVTGLPRSVPEWLDAPAVGIHTRVIPVGLNRDGTVAVPPLDRDAPAGWYRYLASPGEVGAAVLLGHVDTARDGPAVFFRLGALRPGDGIAVRRADRRTARFTVTDVVRYPKPAFPTDAVYGATDRPSLRLITCGGRFDRRTHRYRDVVVVFATTTER
jgi:hypothetical protein